MEKRLTKVEIAEIKQDLIDLLNTKHISINGSADIDVLDPEDSNNFFEILIQYAAKHNISEDDLMAILVDEYTPADYYVYNKSTEPTKKDSNYYRTLNKDKFKAEFESVFATPVQDAFKQELIELENRCPNIGLIYRLTNFWAETGASIAPGSIKGLVNSQKPELKQTNAAELRVGSYGTSKAKPTIYINLNIPDNYIFLGVCHKKDNGEKGEESYIQKSLNQYKRFLAFKTITEENIINTEKDL